MKLIVHIALFVCIFRTSAIAEEFKATGSIDVYFSPKGGAAEAIVKEINNANSEILVQAYSITNHSLTSALIDARKRGVRIHVIIDKSQRKLEYNQADFIAHAGIPIYIDSKHAKANNKIMIIDRQTLITGSSIFTCATEEKNAENLLVLKGNVPLVDRYLEDFEKHKVHSKRYQRR